MCRISDSSKWHVVKSGIPGRLSRGLDRSLRPGSSLRPGPRMGLALSNGLALALGIWLGRSLGCRLGCRLVSVHVVVTHPVSNFLPGSAMTDASVRRY